MNRDVLSLFDSKGEIIVDKSAGGDYTVASPQATAGNTPPELREYGMLLALDLGSTTGFALKDKSSSGIVSGRWEFKNGRFEGGGMRFLRFRTKLIETHAMGPLSCVVFEEVRRHLGVDAAHVYGGLLGTLTAFCEENSIPYEGVPVGTIKRSWTGKGNASKELMIETARRHGYAPIDDNEADAIALLHLKAGERGYD